MESVDSGQAPSALPTGKIPEVTTTRSVNTPIAPMELPRLVMRGALVVVVGALAIGLVLGLWRAHRDMGDELEGAIALAQVSALLINASATSDADLLRMLERTESSSEFRHLQIRVSDSTGRALIESRDEPVATPLKLLIALSDALVAPPGSKSVSVSVPRPSGPPWTMQWIASHASEQREALTQLAEDMVELAVSAALLLLVMRWHIRRSFDQLTPLLSAIHRAERDDLDAMRELPRMRIRELEVIASALRRLAAALIKAESQRRVLSAQVLSLQEDERARIARDLHDELGQELTALSFDAAWLQRRTVNEPEIASVAAGVARHCGHIQKGIRSLLTRLRPMGVESDAEGSQHRSVKRMRSLLEALVRSWADQPGRRTRFHFDFTTQGLDDDASLPLETMLTVYRISQEALTNVARHASAEDAWLRVRIERDDPEEEGTITWTVRDNGIGLDLDNPPLRGNGLAGLKERVWAAGGNLEIGPLPDADCPQPGLQLHAQWRFTLEPAEDPQQPST